MVTSILLNRARRCLSYSSPLNFARQVECPPNPRYHSLLLNFLAVFALAGCAHTTQGSVASRALLLPLMSLGGVQNSGSKSPSTITLHRPTAVSAYGNDVYLIDSELKQIIRYDREQHTSTPFANLDANPGVSIHAASDGSVYVADPSIAEVQHFAADGKKLPSLKSPGNLTRPVAITIDKSSEHVLAVDGLLNQIVIFDDQGMTQSVIKPQMAIAITAIATGTDGIYVTDSISRQVVVLDMNGAFFYSVGSNELQEPNSIAVTGDNIIFVGDNSDQTVRGYRGKSDDPQGFRGQEMQPVKGTQYGKFIAEVGGVGTEPTNFNGITGIALANNLLYVTDSLNSRVQVMTINRPCQPGDLSVGKNHQDEPVIRVVRKI